MEHASEIQQGRHARPVSETAHRRNKGATKAPKGRQDQRKRAVSGQKLMLFRQRCSPKEKTKCEKKLTSRTSGHKPSDRRARRASSDSWLISHSPPFSPLHSNAHEPCHSPFPRQRWHEREKRGWERKREEESGRERERAGERWSEGARERRRDREVDWERERRGGRGGGAVGQRKPGRLDRHHLPRRSHG